MTKIFTALGFIGTILIIVLFNHLTGFELHSFTFFFIVPLGGLLVGAAAASGLFYGHLRYNKPVNKNHYLLGAALGVVAFFGVYYVSYLTTYINANNEINYSFDGDPISYYEIDGEQITFSKYLEISKNAKSQFYFRGRPVGDEVEAGVGFGTLMFYLHILAAAVAGAVVGLVVVGDKRYCEKCKKYTKEKELFKFDVDDQFEDAVSDLTSAVDNISALQKIIKNTKLKTDKVNAYAQVDLEYCPNCHDSRLLVKLMKLNSDSNFEEVMKFRQSIHIKDNIAKAILGA